VVVVLVSIDCARLNWYSQSVTKNTDSKSGLNYDKIKSWEQVPAFVDLTNTKGNVVEFIGTARAKRYKGKKKQMGPPLER